MFVRKLTPFKRFFTLMIRQKSEFQHWPKNRSIFDPKEKLAQIMKYSLTLVTTIFFCRLYSRVLSVVIFKPILRSLLRYHMLLIFSFIFWKKSRKMCCKNGEFLLGVEYGIVKRSALTSDKTRSDKKSFIAKDDTDLDGIKTIMFCDIMRNKAL